MQDRVFYSICFGVLFGVLLRSFVLVNIYVVILFATVAIALLTFFTLISKNKWGIIFSIFTLAFSFGIFRFHVADVSALKAFESRVGQKENFSGKIVDEPDTRQTNQLLTVETNLENIKTKILISTDLNQDFKYGEDISFTGKLKKPENFLTDQGKTFDYINYLRKDGILYVMSYPQIKITGEGNGSKIKSILFYVKEKFVDKINYLIPSPESIFMGGLILGKKSQFDKTLKNSFVNTGTIHIVALSGYNVTIVAEWFMTIFALVPFVSKNFGIGMGVVSIILFILMTGGSSTAIRAGIMATLALAARATGRNYDVARALILAGVAMIILNPLLLVYDVSFQLSFLATIAVIFLAPRIEKYFTWITKRFGLRDIVSITTAAYLFVFPFILYKMGNLSVVALPTNVLILPFIPATMLVGFLTGFVGLAWSTLAVPFAYTSFYLLHYELWVVGVFSRLPFSVFYISNFPILIMILIYTYFVYLLFEKSIKNYFMPIEPF